MRLDINKKYAVTSNQFEFQVIEKTKVKSGEKKGEILESIIAHEPSLSSALKYLLNLTIKSSTAVNDLAQVHKEVEEIKIDIDKALEPLRNEVIVTFKQKK